MKMLVLAVLLAVAQTLTPTPRQTTDIGANQYEKPNKGTNSGKNPSIAVPPKAKTNEKSSCPGEDKRDDCRYFQDGPTINITNPAPMPISWGWRERIAWWANPALALFGFFGVLVGLGSLGVIWRQGRHIIASERAWMVAKINQPTFNEVMNPQDKPVGWHLPIQFQITNLGKTPAIVIKRFVAPLSGSTVDRNSVPLIPVLPKIPPYITLAKSERNSVVGELCAPGEPIFIGTTLPVEFLLEENSAWRSGEKCLYVMGFIEYRDVFGEYRITRFCYAFQKVAPGGRFTNALTGQQVFPPEFQKAGPSAYNEGT